MQAVVKAMNERNNLCLGVGERKDITQKMKIQVIKIFWFLLTILIFSKCFIIHFISVVVIDYLFDFVICVFPNLLTN